MPDEHLHGFTIKNETLAGAANPKLETVFKLNVLSVPLDFNHKEDFQAFRQYIKVRFFTS